jgi:hypothetical protein
MNSASRVTVRWTVLAAGALGLLAAGAGATYLVLRSSGPLRSESSRSEPDASTSSRSGTRPPIAAPASEPASAPASAPASSVPLPDVVVTLTQEAIERAGITVTTVTAGTASEGLRAPGVVHPKWW